MLTFKIHESMRDTADRIAASHGCDLQHDASGRTHIVVQGVHSQGDPADSARIARCHHELETAGAYRQPPAVAAIHDAGHGQGFEDACSWIEDESRELRTEDNRDERARAKLVAKLRFSLASPGEADEGLINALDTEKLEELMGVRYRTDDGGVTVEATAWLKSYNAGWRSAVEARLAELESRGD